MPRRPNYSFERNARAKAKAAKREAKREAKAAAKANKSRTATVEPEAGDGDPDARDAADIVQPPTSG